MSTLFFASASHHGRVRSHQEDSYLNTPSIGLFSVADGMGGHASGEVASRMAVDRLNYHVVMSRGSGDRGEALLTNAFAYADKEVVSAGVGRHSGMGTTLVAALFENGGSVVIAHVGDSRAYVLRGDKLGRLTKDHGVGSRLSKAIGRGGGAEVRRGQRKTDDVYLLCTDGLTKAIEDDVIRAVLTSPLLFDGFGWCKRAADALVDLALDAGGPDNVTVTVIRVG